MFYMAQEMLRLGCRVALYRAGTPTPLTEVGALFPRAKIVGSYHVSDIRAEKVIVFSPYVTVFATITASLPPGVRCQSVFVIPATFWLESPELYGRDHLERLREALVYDIDDVLTQNEEMGDLFRGLARVVGVTVDKKRVTIAPCGYLPEDESGLLELERSREAVRQEMGLAAHDIAIINSGGVWKWTDLDVFLQAFTEFHREHPGNPLKLFLMGLRQPDNPDHGQFIADFEGILRANSDLETSGAIRVFRDWKDAGSRLPRFNFGADLGLNVSKDSMENAQSFRQRFVEYVKACLPVINTYGDPMSKSDYREMMVVVDPGRIESYKAAFRKIVDNPALLRQMRQAARPLRARLRTDGVYRPALQQIMARGPSSLEAREQRFAAVAGLPSFEETKNRRGVISKDMPHEDFEHVRRRLNAVEQSLYWRAGARLRSFVGAHPKMRALIRRTVKIAWWTLTLQLPRKLLERRGN